MPLEDLVAGGLILNVEESPDRIAVHWRGKANARRPSQVLTPYFDLLVAEASTSGRSLAFHFEQIEHFNSSTIALIMQLVRRLEQENVALLLTYDADLKWQKLTFRALRQLESQGGVLELRSI